MDGKFYQTIHTKSAVVRAAFALATEAHSGQSRGMQDISIPYIVHPVMVYHLLEEFGETDEITFAAALLHDVKEDCGRYRNDPGLFIHDLGVKLAENGVTDHEQIAGYIAHVCDNLTNAHKSEMHEGKRLWQVEHAATLTLREAKIKLLDQTASVLDFIMSPNAEDFPNSKVETWNFKAIRLVEALAAAHHPELEPLLNLHKILFSNAMDIINASCPEQEAVLRAAFSWEKAKEEAERLKEPAEVKAFRCVLHRNAENLEKGIIVTELSETAEVVGYYCLVDTHHPQHDERTKTFKAMVDGIESSQNSRRATESNADILADRLVRHVGIKPPMELWDFIAKGKRCGAINHVYGTVLQDIGHSMQQGKKAA